MRVIDANAVENVERMAKSMRRDILQMLHQAGSGHTGGSLSAADIMATLYGWEMRIDPARPDWQERDRMVLSKGHAAPVLYAALAQREFFPSEQLNTLRRYGSSLQGHPDMRKIPGVDASTGSLGQGISWAVGMALAGKIDRADYRVYALLGDGELQEGMVWEAVMAAAHYKLDNLLAIVDNNRLQIDGWISEVMNPEPIQDKFAAFGWQVVTVDGHDIEQLMEALQQARDHRERPSVIVARTIKGRGVSFMENQAAWHGAVPQAEELARALSELD